MPDLDLAQSLVPQPLRRSSPRRNEYTRRLRGNNFGRRSISNSIKIEEIAKSSQDAYNKKAPKIKDNGESRRHFLKLEDDYCIRRLAKFKGISEGDYPAFRASIDRVCDTFAAAAAPREPEVETSLPSVDGLTLPTKAEVLYVNRPDRDMDPITFLHTYWGRYIQAGLLYQDDLATRLDPQLIPNVRSYCQRMAKKHPDRAAEFVAKDHLPPVRPKEAKAGPAITAEPGTVEHVLQKRKVSQRERTARYRARHGIPSPF